MADGKWQETIRTFDRASMVPDEHLEAMDHAEFGAWMKHMVNGIDALANQYLLVHQDVPKRSSARKECETLRHKQEEQLEEWHHEWQAQEIKTLMKQHSTSERPLYKRGFTHLARVLSDGEWFLPTPLQIITKDAWDKHRRLAPYSPGRRAGSPSPEVFGSAGNAYDNSDIDSILGSQRDRMLLMFDNNVQVKDRDLRLLCLDDFKGWLDIMICGIYYLARQCSTHNKNVHLDDGRKERLAEWVRKWDNEKVQEKIEKIKKGRLLCRNNFQFLSQELKNNHWLLPTPMTLLMADYELQLQSKAEKRVKSGNNNNSK